MPDLIFRTEDIRLEDILAYYVPTSGDEKIVNLLKSANPIVLVGSRGTGKSFLFRVAEAQLGDKFDSARVLPVYVSFMRSSLIHTDDLLQFRNWMLARLCTRFMRVLSRRGLMLHRPTLSILAGGDTPSEETGTRMEQIAKAYEESYQNPGIAVDAAGIPRVEEFKDAVEDLCRSLALRRLTIFFDEAAHIFRPEQQRQFFTLFRDLRSPYISCKAAVYPGVTAYGPTFQLAHDATEVHINRDVLDPDYSANMREIVEKQDPGALMDNIKHHESNFRALTYAASGNPRLLLKTVARAPRMNARQTNDVLKEFYRTDIWSEHSNLAKTYAGHRVLVDWGRNFVETVVLPETKTKNDSWREQGRTESTSYFWIHRDAPEVVNEGLRLLAYTGIIAKHASNIRATRAELGTRYAVNLGCLFALEANPMNVALDIARQLTVRRFTEYGANHTAYTALVEGVGQFEERDMAEVLQRQLAHPIRVLDITDWQRERLQGIGLAAVGEVLAATEEQLQRIYYVGPKRSRRMRNAAQAWVLEYLSG